MRCTQCEYRLWNLATRICPECGTPFKPGDFEFVVNSVQFCCPYCDQDYYGTAEKGHLDPVEFDCVKCGRHVHIDEMVLRPTRQVGEQKTQVDRNPWLARRQRGRVKAWFATVGRAMVGPDRLMKATPESSSVWQAWWFVILTTSIASLCSTGVFMLYAIVSDLVAAGGMTTATESLELIATACGPTIAVLAYIGLWGVVTHLMLRLTAAAHKPLRRTFEAFCYSSAANILSAVPCLGFYLIPIAWVWWTVSAILMVRQGHQVSGWRASFAVLVLPVVILVCAIGLLAYVITLGITAISNASVS